MLKGKISGHRVFDDQQKIVCALFPPSPITKCELDDGLILYHDESGNVEKWIDKSGKEIKNDKRKSK